MRSLTLKLILAFLAVSLVGTALVALIAGRTTAAEFGAFLFTQEQVETAQALADYYERNGSWAGVEALLSAREPGPGGGPGMGQQRGRGPMRGANMALADASGTVIVGAMGFQEGQSVSAAALAEGVPIQANGATVGTLLRMSGSPQFSAAGEIFLQQVNQALVVAAVGATSVALLLGILLARTLTRPLREMRAATQAIAAGDLGQRVEVRSRDELGALAQSFNQMSQDLAYAEERRRQLTSDIAHDLRTPISVIQGHAEALRDGVLPADEATFDIIYDEAARLNRLVEDLRTLARAEAGELPLLQRPVSPGDLLRRIVAARSPQAQERDITLAVDVAPGLPEIAVDPDRIGQVLNNLVDNALRHTPSGGTVTLHASATDTSVLLAVNDTGPGIAPEDLPHVFERFYRGDRARRRHEGGSGLGLAIARSLVERHGGSIWVESAPGKGASFIVSLPQAGDAGSPDAPPLASR